MQPNLMVISGLATDIHSIAVSRRLGSGPLSMNIITALNAPIWVWFRTSVPFVCGCATRGCGSVLLEGAVIQD